MKSYEVNIMKRYEVNVNDQTDKVDDDSDHNEQASTDGEEQQEQEDQDQLYALLTQSKNAKQHAHNQKGNNKAQKTHSKSLYHCLVMLTASYHAVSHEADC